MNQLVHETKSLAISTILIDEKTKQLDQFLGNNPEYLPYESLVFPMLDGFPDFENVIETNDMPPNGKLKLVTTPLSKNMIHYDFLTDLLVGTMSMQ